MVHYRRLYHVITHAHMYLAHYPVLAGYLGQRRIYDILRHEYYCPDMANDSYTTVAGFTSCAIEGTRIRHEKQLRLFPAAAPLEFMAMGIPGTIRKSKSCNQHVILLTDR